MRAELRHIDESNYDACIALKVASEQGKYICTNEMSLKEAEIVHSMRQGYNECLVKVSLLAHV